MKRKPEKGYERPNHAKEMEQSSDIVHLELAGVPVPDVTDTDPEKIAYETEHKPKSSENEELMLMGDIFSILDVPREEDSP